MDGCVIQKRKRRNNIPLKLLAQFGTFFKVKRKTVFLVYIKKLTYFLFFHSAITCPNCILGCIVPVQSLDYNSIWACRILEGGEKGYVDH